MPRLMWTAALMLSLIVVSGCALNKGSALAEDFEADWADTPDVAEIDTTGYNTLPYAGSAIGTLILEEGTSADRVAELAGELGAYVADHDHIDGEISLDRFTFSVSPDEECTDKVLAEWRSLVADQVAGAAIEIRSTDEDGCELEVRTFAAIGAMPY